MGNAISTLLTACPFFPLSISVRERLAVALPEASSRDIRTIEKRYYRRMCDFGAEFLNAGYERETPPRMVLDNADVLEDAFESTDIVVCYSGHFVNYELLIQLPALVPGITMYNFFQPSPYNDINDYLCRIRSRHGAILVPTDIGPREMISLKQSCRKRVVIGSLGDLANVKNPTKMKLFGRTYPAYSGTERIGKFLQARFLYANITSSKRGEYHVRFIPIDNDAETIGAEGNCNQPHPITQAFFARLEENIREQPELWLLWSSSNLA